MESKNNKRAQLENELDIITPKLKLALRELNFYASELDFQLIRSLVIKMVQRTQYEIDETKRTRILDFLNDAEEDTIASKILYEKGIWSRSVFLIQQSAEKACKVFGLVIGTLSTADMAQSIKHYTPLVFIKILEDPITEDVFPILKKYGLKDEGKNIANLKGLITSKKRDEFILIEEEVLQAFLSIIDKIRENVIPKYNSESSRVKQVFAKHLPQYKREIMDYDMGEYLFFVTSLYVIGAITFAHEQSARYSDAQVVTPKDYTPDMPIVKVLPKLHAIMEETLNALREYIGDIQR